MFFSRFHSHFFYQHVGIKNGEMQNVSETKHSVIKPLDIGPLTCWSFRLSHVKVVGISSLQHFLGAADPPCLFTISSFVLNEKMNRKSFTHWIRV